jgi:pimeloyl-ACP methyl ester carboxylesterase
MTSLHVNGHLLYYELHGSDQGCPVVLLHHGLGASRSWKEQVPAFTNAGFKVLVYDRWGNGNSGLRIGLDIPAFKDDIEDLSSLLEQLKIERAALVGHSDGGTIALYFAAQYPERIERVLVAAAHIYVETKMIKGIQEVSAVFEKDEDFRKRLQRIHGEKVDQVFRNWYEGWFKDSNLRWDIRPLLDRVQAPVLVIQGEEDEHATPQHASDLAAALPHGELLLEPEAAHMLPQDMPEIFNRHALHFLSRGSASCSKIYL